MSEQNGTGEQTNEPAGTEPAAIDYGAAFKSLGIEADEGTEFVGGVFADESWANKFAQAAAKAAERPDPILAGGFESHDAFDRAVMEGKVEAQHVEAISKAGLPRELVDAYLGRSRALAEIAPQHYRVQAALAISGQEFEGMLSEAMARVDQLMEQAEGLVGAEKIEDYRARLANPQTCIEAVKELKTMSDQKNPPSPPAPKPASTGLGNGRAIPAIGGRVEMPSTPGEVQAMAMKAMKGDPDAIAAVTALRQQGKIRPDGKIVR